MKYTQWLFAVACCVALLQTPSRAAVVYSYVADRSTYDISSGTATVQISLLESLDGSDTSVIAADGGLFGAGFHVTPVLGSGVVVTGYTPAPGLVVFSGGAPSLPDADVTLKLSPDISVVNYPVPDANGLIPLATLTFSNLGGDGANFAIDSIVDGGYTVTSGAIYDLDYSNSAPSFIGASLTTNTFVIAVPEPGSVVGIFALAVVLGKRRRL